ncbi:adenine-specific DNA-methyltransferase [Pedobacter sp. UYP24]
MSTQEYSNNPLENVQSEDWNKVRLEQLKMLMPDLFTNEGQLNINELKKIVDSESVNETERYEFRWFGKSNAKREAFTPTDATLVFDENRSVNPAESDNLIIEGENLAVLKLLSQSYRDQIKCIYIDPPYNKNKDYIYRDTWKQDKLEYWEDVEVVENGLKIDTNNDASGRYHSNWLNMMFSRLLIARQLLKEDGVILISIDEDEVHHLRKIGEEVFGAENYVGEIVWKNSSKNDQAYISIQHEYILFFVKNREINKGEWIEKKEGLDEIYKAFENFKQKHGANWEAIHREGLEWYKQFAESNPIYSSKHYSWMYERGVYFPDNISGPNFGQYRYDVIHPITKKVCKEPASGWRFPKEKMRERIEENLVHFGKDETTVPNNKTYLKNTENQSLTSVKYRDGRIASKKLATLMEGNYFTNPKDSYLLSQIFKAVGVSGKDTVLDFFAGSGSTGEAIQQLNRGDNGERKYILVQLPEITDEKSDAYQAGFKKISDITIQRNKRVIEVITEDKKNQQHGLFDDSEGEDPLTNLGFKVFKLKKSNFPRVEYAPDPEKSDEENLEALKKYIRDKEGQLLTAFNRDELITEILIKNGFKLNYTIDKQEHFKKNEIFLVTDGDKETLICLDGILADETVEYFKANIGQKLIVLERALDTTKKWNLKHSMGDKFKAF